MTLIVVAFVVGIAVGWIARSIATVRVTIETLEGIGEAVDPRVPNARHARQMPAVDYDSGDTLPIRKGR